MCRQTKPTAQFYRCGSKPGGYQSTCKACDDQRNEMRKRAQPDHEAVLRRKRYVAKQDAYRAYARAWYADHAEDARARVAAYRARNPAKGRAYAKRYYRENRDKERAAIKRYWAEHPEWARWIRQRDRARRRGARIVAVTAQELSAKWDYWSGRCWMCGDVADTWDHIKPITRGGLHCLANLRPACRPCNSEKHNHWPVPTRKGA